VSAPPRRASKLAICGTLSALAIAAFAGCSSQSRTLPDSTSDDAGGDVAISAFDAASTVDASAGAQEDASAKDVSAGPDGSPGDGCTYVSGQYTGGSGMCDGITLSCPSTVTAADCSSACPVAFAGSQSAPALKCDVSLDDGGETLTVFCRSPLCQG